jgi:3-hydroxyisobutyrate dehydrogenase-like beta-hydroxyacid dehydrogenase
VSISSVAFIGLGTMGAGMVRNLIAAGLEVRGYNRSAQPAETLAKEGMVRAATPRLATEGADAVITCVSDDGALRSVSLEHESGLVGALREGALWLECGTTSLELTRELASAASERGADFLDAPITGSKLGAASGNLTFMVGGPGPVFDRGAPLFDILGKAAVHVGERVGMGQSAKYCLNMTQAVVLQGVLEGYALAKRLGVSVQSMSEVFENSAGKTGVGSFKTPYLQKGDYEAHFKTWLMHKDLHLALGEASRFRLPLPAANAVRTVYDQGVAEGLGDEDFLALAKLLEKWGDLSFSEGS